MNEKIALKQALILEGFDADQENRAKTVSKAILAIFNKYASIVRNKDAFDANKVFYWSIEFVKINVTDNEIKQIYQNIKACDWMPALNDFINEYIVKIDELPQKMDLYFRQANDRTNGNYKAENQDVVLYNVYLELNARHKGFDQLDYEPALAKFTEVYTYVYLNLRKGKYQLKPIPAPTLRIESQLTEAQRAANANAMNYYVKAIAEMFTGGAKNG
jgi:hypothetical protein